MIEKLKIILSEDLPTVVKSAPGSSCSGPRGDAAPESLGSQVGLTWAHLCNVLDRVSQFPSLPGLKAHGLRVILIKRRHLVAVEPRHALPDQVLRPLAALLTLSPLLVHSRFSLFHRSVILVASLDRSSPCVLPFPARSYPTPARYLSAPITSLV